MSRRIPNKIEDFTKKELIGYINLLSMAMETRPYIFINPTENSKKKFMLVVDKKSSRLQTLKLLFRLIKMVLKEIR